MKMMGDTYPGLLPVQEEHSAWWPGADVHRSTQQSGVLVAVHASGQGVGESALRGTLQAAVLVRVHRQALRRAASWWECLEKHSSGCFDHVFSFTRCIKVHAAQFERNTAKTLVHQYCSRHARLQCSIPVL